MASKTVQPLVIDLGIKGAEKLAGLKSSFRDLSKTVGLTDSGLEEARQGIIKYAKSANQSEALIRGQIKAFEGLREQAELGGKVFIQLGSDIDALKGVLYGASTAVEAKKRSLLNLGSSADATATQIQGAIRALTALRNETRLDSEAFNAFGQSIDKLTNKLEKAKKESQDFASAQSRSGRFISATSGAAKQQIKDLDLVTQALREQRDELGRLEGEARIRTGVASLSERGAVSRSTRSYEEALAEGVLSGRSLKGLLSPASIKAALAEVERQIVEFQEQIENKLSRGLQISFQETARAARESSRAMAAAFADPEFLNVLSILDKRIGALPNTTAGYSQRLRELEQQLANTARGGDQYVQVALRIAQVQREASAATQGLGAALIKDLASGVAVRNQKNLREAIGQLQAEMSELNTETTEGSAKYAENARQVNNLQKELDQIANSYRNVADMTRRATASQVDYGAVARKMYLERDQPGYKTPAEIRGKQFLERIDAERQVLRQTLALPAAGQTSAPGTGASMSGMARSGLPYDVDPQTGQRVLRSGAAETTRRPLTPADLPRDYLERVRANLAAAPSAAVGVAPGVGFGEQVIKKQVSELKEAAAAYRPYNKAIRDARAASNGSISSINNLKNALIAKRNEIPTTSAAFRRLTSEIENLDRKSERVSRRMSRRRMSPMQMTQAAGAVLSGGIFGGPEGFLGGAIGALGGVGGAFAGAAIGAQVGGLRRQLGEFADYAAEIKRLEIALKGITEVQDDAVASQANYSRAVAAAADVTKDLNVPQEVAIRGITRLTAAVKGAGGGVADAELAFKNITSAITATGGGAEQVQGAVTALVQIFSKGKVSAEEINQIAERLPGTFNKIAEASGRTGPELTKALQKGEVGLNDLMKFLVQLGGEYGELAEKIAGSSEAAGQRLQVAYNNMRIEIGNALRPIGAEFQSVFTNFVKDITPAMVAVLPKIGEAALALAKNLDVLAISVGTAFAAMGVAKIVAVGGLSAALLKLAAAAGTASVALKGSAAAALLNPWVALAAGIAGASVAIYKYYEGQKDLNSLLDDGAGSTQVIKDKITEYEDSIRKATAKLKGINGEQKATGRDAQRLKGDIRELREELARLKGTYKIRLEFERKGYKFDEDGMMKEFTVGGIVYGGKRGARARALRRADGTPLDGITEFEKLDGTDKDKGASKIARAMSNAAKLGVQLGRTLDDLRSKINGVGDTAEEAILRKYSDALRKANEQADDNIKAIVKLEKESGKSYPKIKESIKEVRDASKELAEAVMLEDIGKHFKEAIERAQQPLNNLMESFNTQIRERARIEELMSRGMNRSLAEQIANIETIAAKEDEVLRKKIAQAETELAKAELGDKEIEKLEKKIELLKKELELTPGRKESAITGAKQLDEKEDTPVDIITKGFKDAKESLEDLVNLGNIAVNSANMIGEAFSNAFTDVVTGSATAKEALAGMMQSIAQSFIEMAAQIIAKQTTMIILGAILKALGVGLSSDPAGSQGNPFGSDVVMPGAGGSAVGGGRVPLNAYAEGGYVSSPTRALVGEGGEPEYIIPESKMRESMSRYSRGARGGSVIPENGGGSNVMDGGGGTAVAAPIDVRYTVERINSVDYVTADQFQQGLQQAANQGAKQGEQQTLKRLQMSSSTRKRIGM